MFLQVSTKLQPSSQKARRRPSLFEFPSHRDEIHNPQKLRFDLMQEQGLAACGPFLLTKKYHNFCLLAPRSTLFVRPPGFRLRPLQAPWGSGSCNTDRLASAVVRARLVCPFGALG